MENEYPKDCTDCRIKNMTWGCLNGDMPCPWIDEPVENKSNNKDLDRLGLNKH